MTMRHFEAKGGLFRELDVRGSTLTLTIGRAAEDVKTMSMKHRSPVEAKRRMDAWARLAIDAGFTELKLPFGKLGSVFRLEKPEGPGRIRLDGGDDVYFDTRPAGPLPLRKGQRVLVQNVRTDPRLEIEYMSWSKLRAGSVLAFPKPEWNQHRPRPGADPETRKLLSRLAGWAIRAEDQERAQPLPADVPCGALIYASKKGIHRFLKRTGPGVTGMVLVLHEPVLTTTFQRKVGRPESSFPEYCERVPPELVRELEARMGLGEP
jgi:hypothetical protein